MTLWYRPKAPGELWTMAVWGEQLWRHLPPHCVSTNGNTHSALWPSIYHYYNSADLPGKGGESNKDVKLSCRLKELLWRKHFMDHYIYVDVGLKFVIRGLFTWERDVRSNQLSSTVDIQIYWNAASIKEKDENCDTSYRVWFCTVTVTVTTLFFYILVFASGLLHECVHQRNLLQGGERVAGCDSSNPPKCYFSAPWET